MDKKINTTALSSAAAVTASFVMLALGTLGNLGIYTEAVEAMQQWHLFFSLSIGGIILGIIEAFVLTFAITYFFGWLYNMFLHRFSR